MYQVELVWNREFHYVPYGKPKETLKKAISFGEDIQNSGDGARVKKFKVLDEEGEIVYPEYLKPKNQ